MIQVKSAGVRLLSRLLISGRVVFDFEEIAVEAEGLGIARAELRRVVSKLAEQGWLARIRRGLYRASDPIADRIIVHPFAIAMHMVKPSFISHWSAAHYHGLTEQIPRVITASTTKKVVTPSMLDLSKKRSIRKHLFEVEGIKYDYITIKESLVYGIEKIWIDEYSRIEITDIERTLLDIFIHPDVFGGIGEAFRMLKVSLDKIDIQKLIKYAIQCEKKSVIKRLGWVLGSFGVSEKVLKPLLDVSVQYYVRLDPQGPAKGACDKHWMVQDNLKEVR